MENIYQFIKENKTYSILSAILVAQGIFYTFTDNDLMANLTLLFFACVIILHNVEKIRVIVEILNQKELTINTSIDFDLMKRVLAKEIKQVENKIREDLIKENLISKKISKKKSKK